MKAMVTLSCACILLLAGCHSDLPPPELPWTHSFGANAMRPTKMVYIHRTQDLCPSPSYSAGIVTLAYTVEPDGSVSHIRVVSETPKECGFAGDVIFAFRKWKFPPYMEKGVAVPHEATYTIAMKEAGGPDPKADR